jgi:Flp pilus assembly protein CpaB
MGRRTLLLITSILVAAVGTAFIGLYVRGADNRAAGNVRAEAVLVAGNDTDAGTPINEVSIESASRPAKDVPDDALSGRNDVTDKTLISKLYKGQILQRSMFSSTPVTQTGIKPDQVGIDVDLSDPQRAAGLLTVGSMIKIYSLHDKNGAKKSDPVLPDPVEVIQIGNLREKTLSTTTNGTTTTEDIPSTVVGLTLKELDAKRVKDAEAGGALYFMVMPPVVK